MAVDISQKQIIVREATAEGEITLKKTTIDRISSKIVEKGDVLELAKAVAIHSVKQTPNILIYCHPIPILSVKVEFFVTEESIRLKVYVKTQAQTGCEMEALMGVSGGLLQIWDMVKMYEKTQDGQYPLTVLNKIRVLKKVKHSNLNNTE